MNILNKKLKILLVTLGFGCFILYSFTLYKKDDITPSTLDKISIRIDEVSKEALVQRELKAITIKKNELNNLDEEAKNSNNFSNVTYLSHLDEMVNESEQHIIFDSNKSEELSLTETRNMLFSLTDNMTEIESQYVLDSLNDAVNIVTKNRNTFLDAVACSNKICGLLISGDSSADVSNTLNDMTYEPKLNNKLKGGSLRVFEEDGIYFGLMLGVLGNKPLKIK